MTVTATCSELQQVQPLMRSNEENIIADALARRMNQCVVVTAEEICREIDWDQDSSINPENLPPRIQVCIAGPRDSLWELIRPGGCEEALVRVLEATGGQMITCKIRVTDRPEKHATHESFYTPKVREGLDGENSIETFRRHLCCGGLLVSTILRLCAQKDAHEFQ